MNIRSCRFHRTVAKGVQFFDTTFIGHSGTPLARTSNETGVGKSGKKCIFLTSTSLCLGDRHIATVEDESHGLSVCSVVCFWLAPPVKTSMREMHHTAPMTLAMLYKLSYYISANTEFMGSDLLSFILPFCVQDYCKNNRPTSLKLGVLIGPVVKNDIIMITIPVLNR